MFWIFISRRTCAEGGDSMSSVTANIAKIQRKGPFLQLLVLVILFEPTGIYGRWLKLKTYFQTFPMHRRAAFRRQRTYTRSERV